MRCGTLDHGVEIVGYWGEAVRTADEARALHAENRRQRVGRWTSFIGRGTRIAHRVAA